MPRPRRQSFLGLDRSAFVGRASLLDAIGRAVARERLVTLLGEGGVGKTRLAQRYAQKEDRRVVFCDLRVARESEAMAVALAHTLAIDEAAAQGEGAISALGRALELRGPTLVVLDNVEQLLPGAASAILRWLELAPEARFLVTSREPLAVAGETIVRVEPLSTHGGARGDSEAARLFLDRVRSFRKDYSPPRDEAALIDALLSKTRGLPLAIELCASRFGDDDLAGVFGELAPPEGGAVGWAFGHVAPWMREVLGQCSIFRGGFTVAAAGDVVRVPASAPAAVESVAAALTRLLRRNLLQTMRVDGALRYVLCQGVQAPAAEELRATGQTAALALRHAEHYLELAQVSMRREALGPERHNFEAALENGRSLGRRDIVIRAALALDVIASGAGLTRGQLAILDQALVEPGGLDPAMAGRALGVRAGVLRGTGRLGEAERDAKTALLLARFAGEDGQAVAMQLVAADVCFQLGKLDEALGHTDTALASARLIGDRLLEARALLQLASLHNNTGDVASAAVDFESARAIGRELGDEATETRALMGLAFCRFQRGDRLGAEDLYGRALMTAERLGLHRLVRIVSAYLGLVHFESGSLAVAERCLDYAIFLARSFGDARVEGVLEGFRGAVLAARDEVDAARAAFDLAHELLVENRYYLDVIDLFQGHLDLAEARRARAQADEYQAANHVALARRRIEAATRAEVGPSLADRSDDARIALRTLRRALG